MAIEEMNPAPPGSSSAANPVGAAFFDPGQPLSRLLGSGTTLAMAIAVNSGVLALILFLPPAHIYGERGILEVLQVIMLIGIAAALTSTIGRGVAPLRPLLLVLLMMTIAIAMRESDLRDWDVPAWAKTLGSGAVRNPLTLSFVLVAIVLHIPASARQTMRSFVSSAYAAPVGACIVLLICAKLTERAPLGSQAKELLEELIEINAYLLLSIAAVAMYRQTRTLSLRRV
jgi:hypothetical protein